ncbi:hypothetical protein BCR33DRAFT_714903 [Rhizoclosmatium globosum]|uniref:ADP-ribosylation factor-like protein 6-interacting protein 4 n=1 Tax=Rhizoclosmatium globosum TaxID=329046 RepID=A0A1Y2CLF3_9FUNG|nr:hypothetical protein BCR33DRAFT_724356 [Rhizoclosmatium globosum]ORY47849.1 hypothetical protein BCR33DRAFT_714903 [Rhizoclosmatium globosum]|eukprot:ORY30316.1 hypothetical protein BCR33DRAFT_724356 [Rhizoclosmatium globosum]
MGKSKKRDRDSSSSSDSDSSTSSSKHHSHKSKKKHKKDAREKTSKGKKDKKEKHAKKHKKSHSEERDKATVASKSHLAQWMAEGMEAEFGGSATAKPATSQQPPIPPTTSDHKHHLPPSRSIQPPTASNTRTPMVPQRPEEFEREQQQVRRIIDPIDGRSRLVKGTGEIIEEIVSRERHHEINKQATKGDGAVYSKVLHSLAKDG